MGKRTTSPAGSGQIMKWVCQRIERGGERLWRFEDFRDVPVSAVAQALSRLARQGRLERLSKGVYYHARQTGLGKSLPNPAAIRKLASRHPVFPAGIAAANLLGFTTQSAREWQSVRKSGDWPGPTGKTGRTPMVPGGTRRALQAAGA